ncbi:hypothetical protein Tco_1063697 [Tanacetum coccineum]
MKLPVDLNTTSFELFRGKVVSMCFLLTMLANFLPSLGLTDDKELLVNMVAWAILLITIFAFTVPASRRILEHRYKELHGLASYPLEIKFSYEELEHNVKKYWMMAETGNPQFAIACSEDEAKLSEKISRNALKSINQLLSKSEKNEPDKMRKLHLCILESESEIEASLSEREVGDGAIG